MSLSNQAQEAMATSLGGGQLLEPFPLAVVNDAQRIVIRALSSRTDADRI